MGVIPPGELVYGMMLPVQMASRSRAEEWERYAGVEDMMEIAVHADGTGFFYIGVCDHIGIPRGEVADYIGTTWYETVSTLAFVAGLTRSVRLLSSVYVLPYRHPAAVAKAFATIDRLSSGRAILGVGSGYLKDEFDALGADFARRGQLTDEAIDCIRAVFAREFPLFEGKFFRTAELGFAPRPVQQEVPIWVGGRGRAALRRVADRGDGWIPQDSRRAELVADLAFIREEQERAGRVVPLDLGFVTEYLYIGRPTWDVTDRPTICGPAEEIAESMLEVRKHGINHLQVRFRSRSSAEHRDQMSAWSESVRPLLL